MAGMPAGIALLLKSTLGIGAKEIDAIVAMGPQLDKALGALAQLPDFLESVGRMERQLAELRDVVGRLAGLSLDGVHSADAARPGSLAVDDGGHGSADNRAGSEAA